GARGRRYPPRGRHRPAARLDVPVRRRPRRLRRPRPRCVVAAPPRPRPAARPGTGMGHRGGRMRPIAGMSVLVTGGGSGIGEGIARHFCAAGARVTISGRRADKVTGVAASIGDACTAVVGDVTVDTDRAAMIDVAVEHGGGLDVLVNNAGNMYRGPLETLEEQALLDIFHGNVVAAIMLTQRALPHLVDRGGAVIFMGS